MKAGVYRGEKTVEVSQLPEPTHKENEALIKVSYAGICGTDMMIYSGLHPRVLPPLVMGHEFSGVIDKINDNAHLKPGDRVAINPLISCGECYACKNGQNHICSNLRYLGIDKNGGFAQYVKVPVDNLYVLSPSISNEKGALTEPLAVAIHTIRKSSLRFGDVVVILGAGPIGILIGLLAQKAGASRVIISDISEHRLKVAEEHGMTTINAQNENIVDTTKKVTNGVGADVVFEVAGTQSTADQMIEAIKPQGEILLVSVFKNPPKMNLAQMHFREISLKTTRCFEGDDFQKALKVLEQNEIDVTSIISHTLSIDKFEEGFQLMKDTNVSMKVLFQF
ncbi:zinc-binding dehydrogenase [Alteribacillus sp. HJP-4]|uniref:zinc-dependent alcohol dehydrogenase n=1 Tax=Alteribacillus sp. HJP-4 TaxID=2775394 RepID=UPI0035CCFA1F